MAISQAKKLEIASKNAKHFAADPKGAPSILTGIYYAKDGSVIICDRHKLLRIAGAHNFAEPFVSHVVTGEHIDGTYPDTSKLFAEKFASELILRETYNVNHVKTAISRTKLAIEVTKLAADKRAVASIVGKEGRPDLIVNDKENGLYYSAALSGDLTGEIGISLNASYFLNALNVFKDAGSITVKIGFNKPMEPINLLDEENGISVIVLPYRMGAAASAQTSN